MFQTLRSLLQSPALLPHPRELGSDTPTSPLPSSSLPRQGRLAPATEALSLDSALSAFVELLSFQNPFLSLIMRAEANSKKTVEPTLSLEIQTFHQPHSRIKIKHNIVRSVKRLTKIFLNYLKGCHRVNQIFENTVIFIFIFSIFNVNFYV